MSWWREAWGRFAQAMQSWGMPGVFSSSLSYHPSEVTYYQHDMRRSFDPENMTVEDLWATQPHLRTVVDFRARNIAQLGMKLFRADAETRERVRDSDVARVLRCPNQYMTGYELLYDLVASRALYDVAYWVIIDGDSGKEIHPFPASWVKPVVDNYFGAARTYRVQPPGMDAYVELSGGQVVEFRGWTPSPTMAPSSPVETLRLILEEQYSARKHRSQLWKRGPRVGAFVTRPRDAAQWDNTARRRFMDMLRAFQSDAGEKAGGVPLLEDGMEMKRLSFTSADEQWSESVKLSLEAVAQVYQLNPAVVGSTDGTAYSSIRELHRAVFRTMLGADITAIEERITAFVLPLLGAGDDEYIRLNVEKMLRGSFEEQASVLSTSVGGPWMTRNEARALQDMAPMDTGDDLIVPLNVIEGGQASPQDGGDGRPPNEIE